MLLVGRDHLIAVAEVKTREHRIDTVGRRPGQRDVGVLAPEDPGVPGARLRGKLHHAVKVGPPAPALLRFEIDARVGGRRGLLGHRPLGPGVEVRQPFEHRELRAERGRIGHRAWTQGLIDWDAVLVAGGENVRVLAPRVATPGER